MQQHGPDYDEDPEEERDRSSGEGKTALSYGAAMAAFAVLAVLCILTLDHEARYLALLIIGALALKTWLARVKSRLE
jgi:hypothetical protein